jgi:hypothetical protein
VGCVPVLGAVQTNFTDYTTCWEYAQRSWTIIEDISMFVFQATNLTLLILLACLREDYAEGVRLKGLKDRYTTNMGGLRLLS